MRVPAYTGQFYKDIKRMQKRGKDMDALKSVVGMLIAGKALGVAYRDHRLVGNYAGRRECHIQPDWLLVYKLQEETIVFERTGTHSDLFK
ncbi:TPA: type II toxin-antitoxin system mRNA interferase toxin, RelE/StbE family [Candidatus Sumerlaeota bacterium]|jgi:mRNA interferase YafQ|nr:type II toxin-antitoxin system mRNA interferase toxin, RelE/StbE family [Candidatus Sumerlaeota bacterium]